MRFVGSYASLLYDKVAHRQYVQRRLREIMLSGVRAYVNEAKNVIPVWSGASRQAMTQIAGFAGIPIFGPGPASRVQNTSPQPHAKASGDGAASETFEIDDSGLETGKIFFRWKSNLFHLVFNDANNANLVSARFHLINPGPYHIHQICSDAFKSVVREELARFRPNTRQFIKVVRRQIR